MENRPLLLAADGQGLMLQLGTRPPAQALLAPAEEAPALETVAVSAAAVLLKFRWMMVARQQGLLNFQRMLVV